MKQDKAIQQDQAMEQDHAIEQDQAPPPAYGTRSKPTGAATQSPWSTSGFGFPPNTNTMDSDSMPSEKAEAARQKAAQVMAALKEGKPGDADRAMGAAEEKGAKGVFPWKHFRNKLSGASGKKSAVKEDGVVR